MKRIAWLTDLHLDLVGDTRVQELADSIAATGADAVLLGGDYGQVESFATRLTAIADHLERPCYFVLGNHDYYGNTIQEARRQARAAAEHPFLHWLPATGVVNLSEHTALLGHGLWGDGRAGKGERSRTELADFTLITDISLISRGELFENLRSYGDEAAAWITDHLPAALARAAKIYFLAHVPPFADPQACPGRASDDEALPFYTCVAAGEAIRRIMADHPQHHLTVLAGHTHTACELHPAPNIVMITGGARYFEPRLQRVFEID